MTKFEQQRRRLLITIAVLSLIFVSLCGYVYAKYFRSTTVSGTVTITADLGSITVMEHLYERNPDGSYTKTETLLPLAGGSNIGNQYILIPGDDIPKDPFVVVDKPNDIGVYVFLIINETPQDAMVTWEMTENWERIDDQGTPGWYTGPGWLYVYTGTTASPNVVTGDMEIPVLLDDKIIVSQFLLQPDGSPYTSQTITFSAHMYQVASVEKTSQTDLQHAIEVFLANHNSGS